MATQRLRADVQELQRINAEITRLNGLMKPLKERKRAIEANVMSFMKQQSANGGSGLTSIKMSNVEVEAVEKRLRERMKKQEKEHVAVQFLQQLGVPNPQRSFSQLQELIKGDERTVKTLKLKDPLTGGKKK